jgi:Lipopolysaccharide-assembly
VRTNYKVVSVQDGADAVLHGKVLTLDAVPLLFTTTNASPTTPATTRATTMLVTMKCEVTLIESATQKPLYHTDNFVFRNEYEISTDVKSFFSEQDPALDRMADDFARRLVAAIVENY